MMLRSVEIIAITLPNIDQPSVAIAASRAGHLGVIDLEYARDKESVYSAVEKVRAGAKKNNFGVKFNADSDAREYLAQVLLDPPENLKTVILSCDSAEGLQEYVRSLKKKNLTVLLEATGLERAKLGEQIGADGVIAKGHEAGGMVAEETTFILLQSFLSKLRVPVWAHGGIGLHGAAACVAAGAAGVVLDSQLALTREATSNEFSRTRIGDMDGSETLCLGSQLGAACRVYYRPGNQAVEELRLIEARLAAGQGSRSDAVAQWRREISRRVGWDPQRDLQPVGQDAAFAAPLARRYGTVAGVLQEIQRAVQAHCRAAHELRPLDEGSPLASSHGTRYPILQGPMTRVSDVAEFAVHVTRGGALPFLALALMRGPDVRALLAKTQQQMGDGSAWGVGILGFVPQELRQEQLEAIGEFRPPFALIAGGRPDQARSLEQQGIATYLHAPSPGLLKMFLQQGAKRFVFEGRECGGHVGPRSSFVLWNQMIDVLLEALATDREPEQYHIVFAGGIHDSLSASMVAVMAAPLAEQGARIGVLLGSAYLFTKEIVEAKAIQRAFQEQALRCCQTVLLETGPGHATRCVDTPYAAFFEQEKRQLTQSESSAEEIRLALEGLNLGRLRIASKGVVQHPKYGQDRKAPKLMKLPKTKQLAQGMYMIGQVAALRNKVCTIAALHEDVSVASSKRLQQLAEQHRPSRSTAVRKPESAAEVAVIGMACLLPKAPDVDTYWDNILSKVNAVTEVPKERWDPELYFDADPKTRDKVYSKWGGFLDDIQFDPMQYGMPPASLRSIEPAQLLTLDVTRAALQDAGYLDRPFARERTSVILGAGGGAADLGLGYGSRAFIPVLEKLPEFRGRSQEILDRLGEALPQWTEDSFAGILTNVSAGRVANRFDLGGSNFTVDAACASSLAAVSLGLKELEDRSSDMVIVGGVDTMQNPFIYLCFSKTHALSPRGQCRTFDQSADGIAISEGIAVMVLKRLADAERDGDRIYSVIKSAGSSSDGRDKGLTAPRPEGQARALNRAYAKAGVSPSSVGLVEAHGTGTVAGDRAEIQALTRVFSEAQAQRQSCAIGSVKSMIGHTKCTAGIAGLMKTSLALYHKILPPTLGVENPNPSARFPETPFYVNTESRPWLRSLNDHPRRASVSAFGFGGTNFHVVAEEYTDDVVDSRPAPHKQWPNELFLWTGDSPGALLDTLETWDRALAGGAKPKLRDLAYSAWKQTQHGSDGRDAARLALIATSLDDLKQKLATCRQALADPKTTRINDPRGIYFSAQQRVAPDAKTAFLFPGQGAQYPNMMCDLAIYFPEMRHTFELGDRILAGRLDQPLSSYVFAIPVFSAEEQREQQQALTRTNVAQPAIGAADLAMLELLQTFGLQPDMTAGHSYGEYAALAAAGVFDKATLISLSEARGRFIVESAGEQPGTMAAVETDAAAVANVIEDIEGVCLANVNAPRQTVISGTREGIGTALEVFARQQVTARMIPVACAFHSAIVAPAQKRLAEFLQQIELGEPRIDVYSNTTASPYPRAPEAIANRLVEHLVRPVEFVQEIEAMYAAGARTFVEVGPRNILTGLVDQILGDRPKLAIASNQSGRPGLLQLFHLLGQLASQGVDVKLERLYQDRSVRRLNIEDLARESGEAPLAPSVWLVNGARAKPGTEPAGRAGPPQVQTQPQEQKPRAASAAPPSPAVSVAQSRKQQEPEPLVVRDSSVGQQMQPPAAAGAESRRPAPGASFGAGDIATVMADFQHMMSRFLDLQKTVMMSYLGTEPATHALAPGYDGSPLATAGVGMLPGTPVVREQTHAVQAAAAARTASPVDSDQAALQPPASATSVGAEEAPASGPDESQVKTRLLEIVSERTGYPPEMLDLELDLEADLGIDSIKRVEILGNFQQAFADTALGDAEGLLEKLTSVKTLGGIIEQVLAQLGERAGASPAAGGSDAGRAAAAPDESGGQDDLSIQRYTLTPTDRPLVKTSRRLPDDQVILITDDGRGLAARLRAELSARQPGVRVAIVEPAQQTQTVDEGVYQADFDSPEAVARVVESIRQRQGRLGAIVHLLPLRPDTAFGQMDFEAWKARLQLETKSLFLLAKAAGADFPQARQAGAACVLAATGMGGDLRACEPDSVPTQGGVVGLAKTLALEWPDVRVKSVDLDLREVPDALVQHLLDELLTGDDAGEVGYCGDRRVHLELTQAALRSSEAPAIPIDASSVILVTGGARGITARVACRLAERHRPVLLLVGRSPLPGPQESAETVGVTEEKALKAALMAQMARQQQAVKPAAVEQAYRRLTAEREIRRNLTAIRESGAQVHYYQTDVRDWQSFGDLLDQIYDEFGRLDGVIHGAGIIEDRLVQNKSLESFERVFDTKADSAFILSRRLRPETLKFLVFFSSVTARFGNRGQADYGAANEVLNKLAGCLNRDWPGRVVAINWGPWDAAGMVSSELRQEFAKRGVALIAEDVGLQKLEQELHDGPGSDCEVIIGGAGWRRPEVTAPSPAVTMAPPVSTSALSAQPLVGRAMPVKVNGYMELVRELDPSHDLYLHDHQLNDQPVLPFAVAMELMAETVAQGWPEMEVAGLREMRVLQGIVLSNGAKRIRVRVTPEAAISPDTLSVSIAIVSEEQPERMHYRAMLDLAGRLSKPPAIDAPALTETRPFALEVAEAYRRWLFHGPLFQGIVRVEKIGYGGMEAVLNTSSPGRYVAGAPSGPWIIDPLMVDSGLQLLILWAREHWDMTTLPACFQAYRRFGTPSGPEVLCEVRIRPNTAGHTIHTDILFFDAADRRLVAQLEDMEGSCTKALNRLVGRPVSVAQGGK